MPRKKREYKNGYQEKIEYWESVLNGDCTPALRNRAIEALDYFRTKQEELLKAKLVNFLDKLD